MTTKPKNINQTLGFFSITVGWTLMILFYSIYLVVIDGRAKESQVIISWSGLFTYIAWAIFIIAPLNLIDNRNHIFKPYLFPFISAIYAGIVFVILVGGIFRNLELVEMFIPFAISEGFLFGLCYSILLQNQRLSNLLINRPTLKIIPFLSPVIFLTFFLWVLPTCFPSQVFRFMPDEIQDKIFVKAITKFKVGDDFRKLRAEVPGYFDDWRNTSDGGVNAFGPLIDYKIRVKDDTIKELEVTVK